MAGTHSGVVALITSKAAVIMMPIMDYSYKASALIAGLSSPLAAMCARQHAGHQSAFILVLAAFVALYLLGKLAP
jgi:hypothetical protein